MIEALIHLLIVFLITGVVWWIGRMVLGLIPSPLPLLKIWGVVLAVVCLIT
jgi:hypothetical protein